MNPQWIIRYGYISARPIVTHLYYPFSSGDADFEKAVRNYLNELRRVRHLKTITTSEVRKKAYIKDKCLPPHWVIARKNKRIN